jgi:hypothetical protein
MAKSIPSVGDALNGLNDWLTRTTSLWEETGGAMYEFQNIGTEVGIVVDWISARLTGNYEALGNAMGRWKQLTNQMRADVIEQRTAQEWGGAASVFDTDYQPGAGTIFDAEATITGAAVKQGGGGGGGRTRKKAVDVEADLIAGYGAAKQPDFDAGDIYDADPYLEEELAAEQAKQEALLEVQVAGWDQKWQAELEVAEAEKQLQAEKHEWLLANSQEYADAQRRITLDTAMAYTEGVAEMFGNLGSLMESESKKGFEIGKKAAIASAVINTALAAIKAYQAMSAIPIVGPFLGIAAAAAAVVAGGVMIAKIKAQTFDSGSASVSTSSFSSGSASSGGSYPADSDSSSGGGQALTINVSIGDESFGSAMTRINDARSQQGRKAFKVA